MNEQLQSKLVEILSGIQSATKAAGDFALEQLPDIAQQYVVYGRASLTLYVVIGIAGCVGAWLLARHLERKSDFIHEGMSWMFVGGLGGTLCFLVAAMNLPAMLLVWFAPKVWLLKELAALVK